MFTVEPDDISHFDGLQLVQLLRVLLYAEARKSGVPMRNVDVPLQITIADGGKDAAVTWEKGKESTDYLPGRDTIFQCKATDHGDAQWKKEVWTKKSQPKTAKTKVLSEAIDGVLARGGCYVGVTATPLQGSKIDDRVKAIGCGIREAGGDPTRIKIAVYDGNKLAAWATNHPAVAVWIREQKTGMSYASFATLNQWAKRAEIATPPYVAGERTFSLGPSDRDVLDFDQIAGRVVDHLADPGACIRIWGPSGIGKSRTLHHALSTSVGVLRNLADANFIFCDFRDVRISVRDAANQIKNSGSDAVLIVDNCPYDDAVELNDLARADGSGLRVITLGAEGRDTLANCLMIRPRPAGPDVIKGILTQGINAARRDEIDYLAEFCDGYPRIAVLIAGSYSKDRSALKSADDVAEQILKATGLGADTVRALEGLSLFDRLSPDDNPQAFDRLADMLVHMKGELMFEHLVIASERHLVGRARDVMVAQPRPIADFLAMRRLKYLRTSTLSSFLGAASSDQSKAMLSRWRYLGRSEPLIDLVRLLRSSLDRAGTLLDENKALFLAPFVHVDPNSTASLLFHKIGTMPLKELAKVPITDGLLQALRLIATRVESFPAAAGMVIRLAAVADLKGSAPIMELLRQLFQVALAGTEADDRRRRKALLEALSDEDSRVKAACVEALGAMLRTQMTRSIDFEQVGAEAFRAEWLPTEQATIISYFRWALERLLEIWSSVPELQARIEQIVAQNLRNLLGPELLPVIQAFVVAVTKQRGLWFDATKSIGDWLYFDRTLPPNDFAKTVRGLYDETLPVKPVEQALLYSRFWSAELHDPDQVYNPADADFEYSARRAQALAPEIARDPVQLSRAITVMASEELNGPYAFAATLAEHLADPLKTFQEAVDTLDRSTGRGGIAFVRSLLTALDRRLEGNQEQDAALVAIAESSTVLSAYPMDIHTALRVTDERLQRIADNIREKRIGVFQVVPISYGRGLKDTSYAALAGLINALVDRTEDGGAWAALEILVMVTLEKKTIPSEIVELAKDAIVSPAIVVGIEGNATMAGGHAFDQMLRLIERSGAIDDAFGRGFALQIERACRSVGSIAHPPSDTLRAGLGIVVRHVPKEVWAVLAGFYEIATRAERKRLDAIVAATKPFTSDVIRTGPGPLFEVPRQIMVQWAEEDVDDRIGFLVGFFPVLQQNGEAWEWHPAMLDLAACFGTSVKFRDAIRARIIPSSWAGSINAHLTSFISPLKVWAGDPTLGDWARDMLEAINLMFRDPLYQN